MPKKLKFAIIGCGRMGSRRAEAIKNHKEAELVCVVDSFKSKAEALGRKFCCPHYEDYRDALSCVDIDCVIVSTPNKFHRPISVKAMKMGKHVFCEKPLARNPEEALEMVEVASKSNVFLKTGSNLRYFLSVIKARELLHGKLIGDIIFLRGWIGNDGRHLKDSWYSDPEMAGGGTFLDNGCHLLDLLRLFLGEVEECMGQVVTAYWPIFPLEDNGFAIFKTTDGKQSFIQSSWTEWNGYMYMEIVGEEGYIYIDNRNGLCKTIVGNREKMLEVFDYSLQSPTSYQLEFEDFIKAIREKRQPLASGYDGLRAVRMAYGVYESSKTGKTVKI